MSKKIKPFDQDSYSKIPVSRLILFTINLIVESGRKCTFENLALQCFHLFPKTFGFSQHPQYLDSRKLDRPLRFLRRENLVTADSKNFFCLTKKGGKIAQEIEKSFCQKKLFK